MYCSLRRQHPEEKKQRLNDEFEIAMTVEFESEVQEMCNLSKALVEQGIKQGIKQGIELGKEERSLSMAADDDTGKRTD